MADSDPAVPGLGIFPQELKSGSQRNIIHSHAHYNIIDNRQDM